MTRSQLTSLLLASLFALGCTSLRGPSEDVSFLSADSTHLQGTLAFPQGAQGPVPAVLLLHGAEAGTRKRLVYKMHANIFLERGMAVLLVDKRGAGQSGGNYEESTYAQLVDDAVAAITLLRERADVDPARVGIVSASESGWLTPEIAERSGGLAFVINKVGPAVSVRETIAWETYNDLREDGVDEESARQQTEIFRSLWAFRIAPTQGARDHLERTLRLWRKRPDSQLPIEIGNVSQDYVADLSYDPTPFLDRLATPFFYLYGTEDINVPTEICVKRLRELAAAGKPVSFHVFEGGHELGRPSPLPPFYRFIEGYESLLVEFAERHVGETREH